MKKKLSLMLAAAMVFTAMLVPMTSLADQSQVYKYSTINIAFTGDINSQMNAETDGSTDVGGYALMKSALKAMNSNYTDNVYLFSPGNFAKPEGVYQYNYESDAVDLRMLAYMGFDVTGIGGGELSMGDSSFEKMISAAEEGSKDDNTVLPFMSCTNLDMTGLSKDSNLDKSISTGYAIVEKNNTKLAVFGVMDQEQIPEGSKLKAEDPAQAAKDIVKDINDNDSDVDMIVCLYSGSDVDAGKKLASDVDGINVVITDDKEATKSVRTKGDTTIVSAGAGSDAIGRLTMVKRGYGDYTVGDYTLIDLDSDTYSEDADVADQVQVYEDTINDMYFGKLGYKFNEKLGTNSINFDSDYKNFSAVEENGLGDYIADAYRESVTSLEGKKSEYIAVGVLSSKAINKPIDKGTITPSDLFDIAGTEESSDGLMGRGLVSFYVNGEGLNSIAEADVSLGSSNADYRLYTSGLTYEYNNKRFSYNKTFNIQVEDKNGDMQLVDKNAVYRVVCDEYTYQILSQIRNESNGFIAVDAYDKDGSLSVDATEMAIMSHKYQYKEWMAVADYLDDKGKISTKYKDTQNRKTLNDSVSRFVDLNKAGKIKVLMFAVPILIIILIVIIIIIVRARRKANRMFISDRQKKSIFAPVKKHRQIFADNSRYKKNKRNKKMFK